MRRFALLLLGFTAGCAHMPVSTKDPAELFAKACEPGAGTQSIKGSVWLKAQSKEASGQFPAVVEVSSPGKLRLEVTNLLGGTEAVIHVDGQKYTVESAKKKRKTEEGYGSWGGIPLHWATDLFLGRIPCPPHTDLKQLALSVREQGELEVRVPRTVEGDEQLFVYRFRQWGGVPWPESLHWERKGNFQRSVDFKFDDPDDSTHSPKKWEAASPQGEVKVRWKDREIVSSAMR